MFAAKNGKDLGVVPVEEGKLSDPWGIRWCKKTSSLILTNERDDKRFISVIAVKKNPSNHA